MMMLLDQRQPTAVPNEILSNPTVIGILCVGVFSVFLGAIRVTRASIGSSIASLSFQLDEPEETSDKKWSWSVISSWKMFWKKFPRRTWNFYIEAFLVPAYRKEWGKYRIWSYHSRDRPYKSEQLRQELKIQRQLLRQTKHLTDKHPRPIRHSHGECERIRINVGGVKYETQLRTLERFPDTLLGSAEKRIQHYDPQTREYYFDRHRLGFEAILYYYQSGGRFRRPENIASDVLLEDAQFFQLSETVIEQFKVEEGMTPASGRHDLMPSSLFLRKIWLLFDSPESSVQARVAGFTSIGALVVSIVIFCIESIQDLELRPEYAVDETSGEIYMKKYELLDIQDPFFFTETVCNAWFIFEFLARFGSAPYKWAFIKNVLNLIDLVAIIPYLIAICVPSTTTYFEPEFDEADAMSGSGRASSATDSLYLLRVVRLVRVFRIFKLSKHSKGLKILGKTLKASLNELFFLIFFVFIGVILFASTMYFAELGDPDTQFDSIPGGFWWALITITTVGYGDVVPKTPWGKVVGSLCAVAGFLTIALPVPVIVSNFNFFYHQAIDEHSLKWLSMNHVSSCPYRPIGNGVENGMGKTDDTDSVTESSDDDEFGGLKAGKRKR